MTVIPSKSHTPDKDQGLRKVPKPTLYPGDREPVSVSTRHHRSTTIKWANPRSSWNWRAQIRAKWEKLARLAKKERAVTREAVATAIDNRSTPLNLECRRKPHRKNSHTICARAYGLSPKPNLRKSEPLNHDKMPRRGEKRRLQLQSTTKTTFGW